MSREIADSDDEDIVAIRPTSSNKSRADSQKPSAHRIPSSITHDFPGPTQLLPKLPHNDQETEDFATIQPSSIPIDSSTNRFLKEAGKYFGRDSSTDLSQEAIMGGNSTASKKRSRTESKSSSAGPTLKKIKKYGSDNTPKPAPRSKAQEEFQSLINSGQLDGTMDTEIIDEQSPFDSTNMISIDSRTQYTSQLEEFHDSIVQADVNGGISQNTVDYAASRSYMPPPQYTPQQRPFSSNVSGMTTSNSSWGGHQSIIIEGDMNPFGPLSQASRSEDLEAEETRGTSTNTTNDQTQHASETSKVSSSEPAMIVTPNNRSEQMREMFEVPDDEPPQGSPDFSPITAADDLRSRQSSHVPDPKSDTVGLDDEPVKPAKKRGRKSKTPKPILDDVDELQLDDLPRTSRAGTVDSIMSEMSHATTASKASRGKGRKKKIPSVPPEVMSKKLPSSDLGLDSKAVIGLSPERYKPRPSRRRQTAPESVETTEIEKNEIVTVEAPARGKKGRKAKAKKTKSEVVVLEDDEAAQVEESVETNNKPEPDVVPELEDDHTTSKIDVADDEEDEIVSSKKRKNNVLVNIPVLPIADEAIQEAEPVPEPKKRGRKKKKIAVETVKSSIEVQVEEVEEKLPTPEPEMPVEQVAAEEAKTEPEIDVEEDKENMKFEEKPPVALKAKSTNTPFTPARKETSPLKPMSSAPLYNKNTRIGLSKRHSIPSLLRKVDRNKEAPKNVEKKEKLNKRQLEEKEQERIAREEAEAEGREYTPLNVMRGKDGMLVEWDF